MSVAYYLEETYQNLKHHKLRSILTGVGVTWGIFILVILLGAGEGFANGVMRRFSRYVQSVITCYAGYTPQRGRIEFKVAWLNQFPYHVEGVQYVTSISHVNTNVRSRDQHQRKSVIGVDIYYHKIAQLELKKGRFLNHQDMVFVRPVCVIGDRVSNDFFKNEDPLGKFLYVFGTSVQVVGVLDKDAAMNNEDQDHVLIASQTLARLYKSDILDTCSQFKILLKPRADATSVEQAIRTYLVKKLQLTSAEVDNAFYIWNIDAAVKKFNNLFDNIRLFLWVIGIFIMLNGLLGVSNMMLVTVHERIQEIGIRKVLGASAWGTRIMILSESICISLTAGLVGMMAGMVMIRTLNSVLDYIDPSHTSMMDHLVFRWPVALGALFLLMIAGAVAGIVPAQKAMAILPIQALRTE